MKAINGEETICIIHSHTITLIFLDIIMSIMDRYEVMGQFCLKYYRHIIFLSTKISDFDKVAGLVLGSDDCITKPF
ncbi:response regulator [Bacillus thuringiensis]|uniref:response regulator n=1 Tax=Bacillus thuringiensis TaxID=1428 RepID=UPI000BEDE72D|nr:hypothetical protein COM67_10460 [Bacillus thuringiensis]PEB70007.1 hypothetical protein COM91_10805 [Bacillus thuringiensis]PEY85916.1 hypothetical protein CN351_08135 [Bacillus thuringiensis]PFD30244.1 hypothetical protein CN278_25855 [Bacillus thuringiensis]PFI32446.1 hypothetical protein COI77_24860 [Bacillus thuringiensis]